MYVCPSSHSPITWRTSSIRIIVERIFLFPDLPPRTTSQPTVSSRAWCNPSVSGPCGRPSACYVMASPYTFSQRVWDHPFSDRKGVSSTSVQVVRVSPALHPEQAYPGTRRAEEQRMCHNHPFAVHGAHTVGSYHHVLFRLIKLFDTPIHYVGLHIQLHRIRDHVSVRTCSKLR